jgi:hypothetical protein
MVTRSLIAVSRRSAGGMALAACLTRLALAQPLSTQAPTQPISPDALGQVQAHLAAARVTYERGRTSEAEGALERAETELLNQPPGVEGAHSPDTERAITDIGTVRQSLARRDRQGVLLGISDAMSAATLAARVPVSAPTPLPAAPAGAVVTEIPAPMLTYALLPGHWALQGWKYAWVPPEALPRRAEYRPFVQGHYVWRNGEWEWVPAHYDSN